MRNSLIQLYFKLKLFTNEIYFEGIILKRLWMRIYCQNQFRSPSSESFFRFLFLSTRWDGMALDYIMKYKYPSQQHRIKLGDNTILWNVTKKKNRWPNLEDCLGLLCIHCFVWKCILNKSESLDLNGRTIMVILFTHSVVIRLLETDWLMQPITINSMLTEQH